MVNRSVTRIWPAALYMAIVVCVSVVSLADLKPSASMSSRRPSDEPSIDAIYAHLRQIACKPHPVATSEHNRVRDYLMSQLRIAGLQPEIQHATATWDTGGLIRVADIQNIVVEIPGRDPAQPAILLASHYDSVPQGPGAADDAAAVAIMLELGRAFELRPPSLHAVVLLFSDGEELGLLGARAFVAEHPFARQIGVAVNLDARGSGGRPFVFETSGGSAVWIRLLGRSGAPVLAASYAYEGYRRTGNDTDFTVFRKAGIPGYNIAFFDQPATYHTALDTVERLDAATVSQETDSVYRLVRYLAQTGLPASTTDRQTVYSSLPGGLLLQYPSTWFIPGFVTALIAGALWWAVRRRKAGWAGILSAFGLILLAPALAVVVSLALDQLFLADFGPGLIHWQQHDSFWVGALITTASIVLLMGMIVARRASRVELVGAVSLTLGLLSCAAARMASGTSYLFLIPAIFSGVPLVWEIVTCGRESRPGAAVVIYGLSASPAVLLWTEVIAILTVALGIRGQIAILFLFSLLLALVLVPILDLVRLAGWRVTVPMLALAAAIYSYAGLASRYATSKPLHDHLMLAVDQAAGTTLWSTFDHATDDWTAHYITTPTVADLGAFFGGGRVPVLASPAKEAALEGPKAEVRESPPGKLDLWIEPAAGASAIRCDFYTDSKIETVLLNGKRLPRPRDPDPEIRAAASFVYYNPPPKGFLVSVSAAGQAPLLASLVDLHYWPEPARERQIQPRPANIVAGSDEPTDCTLVRREYRFLLNSFKEQNSRRN